MGWDLFDGVDVRDRRKREKKEKEEETCNLSHFHNFPRRAHSSRPTTILARSPIFNSHLGAWPVMTARNMRNEWETD